MKTSPYCACGSSSALAHAVFEQRLAPRVPVSVALRRALAAAHNRDFDPDHQQQRGERDAGDEDGHYTLADTGGSPTGDSTISRKPSTTSGSNVVPDCRSMYASACGSESGVERPAPGGPRVTDVVEGFRHQHELRVDRDVVLLETFGIAAAVEALVMLARDDRGQLDDAGALFGEHFARALDVRAEQPRRIGTGRVRCGVRAPAPGSASMPMS